MNNSIHYFLCRLKDHYYRVGIDGNKDQAQFTFGEFYDSVEYIDEFADVIPMDVEEVLGKGGRRFKGDFWEFKIVTCKFIYELRTKRDKDNYFEWLKEFHQMIRHAVEWGSNKEVEEDENVDGMEDKMDRDGVFVPGFVEAKLALEKIEKVKDDKNRQNKRNNSRAKRTTTNH